MNRCSAVAVGNYAAGTLNTLAQSNMVAGKNGFLYVWVSNETQGWPVFFDNLNVQVRSGPLLEETHYYPFGLTMAGISDKALKSQYAENKYRYNGGNELQNKEFSDGSGLEAYDAENRMYDPQLGRFWQIDPLADLETEGWSPYTFALDNPVLLNDPTGLTSDSSHPQNLQLVTVTPGQNGGVHRASVGATGPGTIAAGPISSAPTSALVGGSLMVEGAAAATETAGTVLEGLGSGVVEALPPVAVGTVIVGTIYILSTPNRISYTPPAYNPAGDITIGIPKPYIPPGLKFAEDKRDYLRGGKQNKRDSDLYGLSRAFRDWYHQKYKKRGDKDLSREELEELYEQWKAEKHQPDR